MNTEIDLQKIMKLVLKKCCLLYTSDAADD